MKNFPVFKKAISRLVILVLLYVFSAFISFCVFLCLLNNPNSVATISDILLPSLFAPGYVFCLFSEIDQGLGVAIPGFLLILLFVAFLFVPHNKYFYIILFFIFFGLMFSVLIFICLLL